MTPNWLTSSSTGIINFQEVESFNYNINTQDLLNGTYYGKIVIEDTNQNLSDTLEVILSVDDNVSVDKNIIPKEYMLEQNFPNPFNPSTEIKFSIPKSENVSLFIYDLLGNEVKKIVDSKLKEGQYKYKWSGENNLGDKISAGMYFYKIQAGSFIKTKKMILLK